MQDHSLRTLRDQIPSYNQVQKTLHDYLIDHSIQRLHISTATFLQSIDYVFNSIQKNSNPRSKAANKDQPKIEELFSRLYNEDLGKFCELLVKKLRSRIDTDREAFVEGITEQIRHYKTYMFSVYKIFLHLDGMYLRNRKTSLFLEGAKIFRDRYIKPLLAELNQAIFELLTRYKEGIKINEEEVETAIAHIGLCGFYDTMTAITLQKPSKTANPQFVLESSSPYETVFFKDQFVKELVRYVEQQYRDKSRDLLRMSTPQYVEAALHYIELEQNVATRFYNNNKPREQVIMTTKNILANINGRAVMDNESTGLYSMFEHKKEAELKRIYQLLFKSDHKNHFCSTFVSYIDREGTAILDKITAEDEKQLKKERITETVLAIIELKNLVDGFVSGPFGNDPALQQTRDHAFQSVVNKSNKMTNFLCHYVDLEFKKSKGDNEDFSTIISNVMRIYKYLYSSDAFLKMYQKLLTMRILNDQFKNRDNELDLINKLKSESGASALTKITTMISDIDVSDKFNNENVVNRADLNDIFTFRVTLLTSGSWPIQDYKSGRKLVPKQLEFRVLKFEQLYEEKFPSKTLSWIFMYGNAELEVKFAKGPHTLKVSGFQLLVLLLFESTSTSTLSVGQILSEINTKEEVGMVNAAIIQLTKLKILTKTGEENKASPDDMVTFNEAFTYKMRRVMCIQTQKYVEKPNQSLTEEVMREREVVIDSIVVRVMKTRKVCKYEEVINETCKLCKNFKCEVGMVKRRLESLIEKDYLKRDEKEANMLIYIPS